MFAQSLNISSTDTRNPVLSNLVVAQVNGHYKRGSRQAVITSM